MSDDKELRQMSGSESNQLNSRDVQLKVEGLERTSLSEKSFILPDVEVNMTEKELYMPAENEQIVIRAVNTEGVDTLFSWIVVAASFVNCLLVGVMFIGFSMLYIAFDEHFETTKAVSGWIGSLYLATGNICGKCCSFFFFEWCFMARRK